MAASNAYSNTGSDVDTYGFDCRFEEEPPSKLICPICAMILRDPHQTQCCGAHYCYCCVSQLERKSAPCMSCGGVVKSFRDVSVTQLVNALRVKCSNSYWGCEWIGQLGGLGEHSVECEKKPAKCVSCGLFVPREICRDHQEKHCPKRIITCSYCSNFTAAYDAVRDTHWPVCPKFPIECPTGCSSTLKFPKDQLTIHLKEDCKIQQKIKRLSDTIEMLEINLEQKEQRIEELEAEIQGSDKPNGDKSSSSSSSSERSIRKSRSIFKRKNSRPYEDTVPKETLEELPNNRQQRVPSDDARSRTSSAGKERNLDQEVKVLKECIVEKVSEIEQLRMKNVDQCTSMAQMEEDFTAQLQAMKNLCKRMNDDKEMLEEKLAKYVAEESNTDRISPTATGDAKVLLQRLRSS